MSQIELHLRGEISPENPLQEFLSVIDGYVPSPQELKPQGEGRFPDAVWTKYIGDNVFEYTRERFIEEEYPRRQLTQVQYLEKLADVLVQFPNAAISFRDITDRVNQIVSSESFNKYSKYDDYARALAILLKLQLFNGDFDQAQESLEKLEKIKDEQVPFGATTKEGKRGQSTDINIIVQSKIIGSLQIARAQGIMTGDFLASSLTDEQIGEVLKSEDQQAIIALGFLRSSEVESLLSNTAFPPAVRKSLLTGLEQRIQFEETKLQNYRRLIKTQRENLP